MPYYRRGKVVYKKVGKKFVVKGRSKTVAEAKKYMKALYAHSGGK